MLGNFSSFYCRQLTFIKINFYNKFFQEQYQSVKQFGSVYKGKQHKIKVSTSKGRAINSISSLLSNGANRQTKIITLIFEPNQQNDEKRSLLHDTLIIETRTRKNDRISDL